jgi:hypothetical protein
LEGDADGNKWNIKSIDLNLSIDDCGRLCDHEKECNAIEWSPTKHICTLIRIPKPDGPKYQDYIFCSKQGTLERTNNFTQLYIVENIFFRISNIHLRFTPK